jgi:hypothetical protein
MPVRLDNGMLDYLGGLVLFDVPDDGCGVLNVGHLRHVNFVPFGYFPSQILGGSRPNPMIPKNETAHVIRSTQGISPASGVDLLYDYSYLLNDAIFDNYFVSTKMKGAAIGGDLGFLVNRRFKLLNPGMAFDGKNLAEVLLIDGAFNVNSCDRIAWQCILSSARNSHGDAIFPRFYSPRAPDQFPSCDEKMMKNLSEKLVSLARKRGRPFRGIGDFANRTVAPNLSDCGGSGILQTAIDESDLNFGRERIYVNFSKGIPEYDDASASGYLEENLPTIINQGDVLQVTAHFLCARGDTFLVRAFGDCVDANGKTIERAYCEAIVQRVPEYVNGRENVPSDYGDDLSAINNKFGRRYKIILFRWLDDDEI